MPDLTFEINILPDSNSNVTMGDSTHHWNIVSPSLTGVPTAPTATSGTNTTQVATTAFVQNAVQNSSSGISPENLVVVSEGNIHSAISQGEYIYIVAHPTLTNNAIYKATQNIAQNATLSSSNCELVQSGVINALATEKAPKANPNFTGSISLARDTNTTVGSNSFAGGLNSEASGDYSFAYGFPARATGNTSFAENSGVASGPLSHAEGNATIAAGRGAHAEGINSDANGDYSHAEGINSDATGDYSHAEGNKNIAYAPVSHAEGLENLIFHRNAHVSGKYNYPFVPKFHEGPWEQNDLCWYGTNYHNIKLYKCKSENYYESFNASDWDEIDYIDGVLEIIGNGINENSRSNARMLDASGNEYLSGDLYINCSANSDNGHVVPTAESFAIVEYENTATHAITKGQYVYWTGFGLCLALNDIAIGDTLDINLKTVDGVLNDFVATSEAYYIDKSLFINRTSVNSNASVIINDAILAAQAAHKNYCVIPPGEYWLTSTVYLADGVILKGSGMDSTILKIADDCDIDAIRVHGPINNAGIMDLTVDGNRIQNYSTYLNGHHGNAINVWLHYGLIKRVRTNWVYKHSLLLNYDTGSGNDGLGFAPEHQNDMGNLNKVLWCDFRDSLQQAIMWGWRTMDSWMCYTNIGSHAANLYLEGGTSRFIGNHFDGDGDNGAGPEYNVYCGDGCMAMLFDGNIFENTQKENIYFRKPSYSNQSRTISFTNNIIRTCSKSVNNTYANIFISGYDANAKAEQIIISNNQILNPDTNANHGYAGIHLDFCKDVKITGNTFFNIGSNNVVIEDTCENILNDDVYIDNRFKKVVWEELPAADITQSLASGTYLVVCDGTNTALSATTDVYIVVANNNGHITSIKDAGSGNHCATITISGRTLTISPVSTYTTITITKLS